MADEIDWDELDALKTDTLNDPAFDSLGDDYIPGEGDNPRAMIIGEAPGAQEQIRGRPFVGPAGLILRQLMHVAGLSTTAENARDDYVIQQPNCWLTNTVKFRPPGNRKPTILEVQASRQYLVREWIAIGKPRVLVLVGWVALFAITGKEQSILRAAGKMHTALSKTDGEPLYVWPMVHPSFGLRNPGVQPLLEQDWQKLGEWLSGFHSR